MGKGALFLVWWTPTVIDKPGRWSCKLRLKLCSSFFSTYSISLSNKISFIVNYLPLKFNFDICNLFSFFAANNNILRPIISLYRFWLFILIIDDVIVFIVDGFIFVIIFASLIKERERVDRVERDGCVIREGNIITVTLWLHGLRQLHHHLLLLQMRAILLGTW